MRRLPFCLISLALLGGACSSASLDAEPVPTCNSGSASCGPTTSTLESTTTVPSTKPATTVEIATTAPPATSIAATTTSAEAAAPGVRIWTGTIDGDIDVVVTTEENAAGVVSGDIHYVRADSSIRLLGTQQLQESGGRYYILNEVLPDGLVSGSLLFTVDAAEDTTTGTWAIHDRELALELSGVADADITTPFDTTVTAGNYDFQWPSIEIDGEVWAGAGGGMYVTSVGSTSVTIDAARVNGPPGYHIAAIGPEALPLIGNRAMYEPPVDGFIDCAIAFDFYGDFVSVIHVDERWECEFGLGASLEGQYLLTS